MDDLLAQQLKFDIQKDALTKAAERERRLVSGLLEEKTKLKEENKRLTGDNQVLRDQLTILHRECKHLGKRPVTLDLFEEQPIQESVAR